MITFERYLKIQSEEKTGYQTDKPTHKLQDIILKPGWLFGMKATNSGKGKSKVLERQNKSQPC